LDYRRVFLKVERRRFTTQKMITVVLGLGGGCFELLQPWIDDGTLSTFSKITRRCIAIYKSVP
jgi:hypothetical protein